MKRLLLGVVLAVATAPVAFPWGVQGHAAIGLIAEQNLTPAARRQVEQILGNTNLAAIASWMDDLRSASAGYGPLAANAEARQFAKRFPHNQGWHYDDMPLGETEYRDDDPFANQHDVVHELNHAIDVLEGRATDISPRIGLYMLVHFVGDVHQPLHVGCGYYDLTDPDHPKLLTDPAECAGKKDDKGANLLQYGPDRWDELHEYWDTVLLRKLAHGSAPAALAKIAMDSMSASDAITSGDYHHWAETWATESIAAARQVYAGIALGAAEMNGERLRHIAITLPAGYDARSEPIVTRRIAQAGYRLAALLNTLQWPN